MWHIVEAFFVGVLVGMIGGGIIWDRRFALLDSLRKKAQ
jgi:hypothetical protein